MILPEMEKKDRFKATADSQSGYMKIYLNGIYKQRIFIGKGADLYWCSISKRIPIFL